MTKAKRKNVFRYPVQRWYMILLVFLAHPHKKNGFTLAFILANLREHYPAITNPASCLSALHKKGLLLREKEMRSKKRRDGRKIYTPTWVYRLSKGGRKEVKLCAELIKNLHIYHDEDNDAVMELHDMRRLPVKLWYVVALTLEHECGPLRCHEMTFMIDTVYPGLRRGTFQLNSIMCSLTQQSFTVKSSPQRYGKKNGPCGAEWILTEKGENWLIQLRREFHPALSLKLS